MKYENNHRPEGCPIVLQPFNSVCRECQNKPLCKEKSDEISAENNEKFWETVQKTGKMQGE